MTPLPDGSGVTTGTLGPQDTTSWSFASSYQRTFSTDAAERAAHRRHPADASAARPPSLSGTASASLGLPGIPSTARFPNTLPTFLIAGYQQLGSPPNTATDFSTSVTEIADTLTWLKGRHTVKAGADLRWERLNVVQPPSPTGSFTFSNLFTDLPGTANTGTPLASFLLGQVQQFSIDLQQDEIRNRAHFQEYFVQDDWRLSDRVTVNAGVRYTLNFPSTEENDQVGVFNLETQQLEYLGPERRSRAPRGSCTSTTSARAWASSAASPTRRWPAPATAWSGSRWPASPRRSRRRCSRSCRRCRSARSTTSRRRSRWRTGPSVAPIPLTPDAGLGQGVFAVDRDLGSGYVQQWNASVQRELTSNISVEVAYIGLEDHARRPSRHQPEPAHRRPARARARRCCSACPIPYFGIIPRSSSLGDPTIHAWRSC